MTTTFREYWLILVFVLVLAATIGVSYGKLLVRVIEQPLAQLEARR